jgi:membrane protein YqaA with SNARE-associated domain
LLYLTLFGWSFLAATILPLSSEAPFAALVWADKRVMLPLIVATVGNYLGACTTYWIGRKARQALSDRTGETPRQRRAMALLRHYGPPTLLLSWVPLLGDALVAIAGGAGMPFIAFSFWTFLGKLLRYAAVAWIVLQTT